MTGAHAGTGVAVKVLVKEKQVSPMRVGLELLQFAEYRPVTFFVTKEDVCHPARQLTRDIPQRLHVSRPSRELNFEIVTEIVVEFLQGLDQQKIHRKPDGATPVRIASEESGQRFARLIVHTVFGSVDVEYVRMFPMENNRRSPIPSLRMQAKFPVRSGRLSINHSRRRLKSGSRSSTSGSRVSTANSGINPTKERIFIGNCEPSDSFRTS